MVDKKVLKLTFDQLIAKKIEKDKNEVKFIDIEVPSMGGTLTFSKPLEEEILKCMDSISDGLTSSVLVAYDALIYACCAYLKDEKLHEQLEIKDPENVVKTMFEVADRLQIGNELLKFSGMSNIGKKVKKQ